MSTAMRFCASLFLCLAGVGAVGACSSSSSSDVVAKSDAATSDDAGASSDAGEVADAAEDADKSSTCATTFGQAIASVGFARFDGTVVAVVPPNDQACTEPNFTHLVVQIMSEGAVYRMVIDVDDADAKGTIHTDQITHALVGGAWADGWKTVSLDYPADLGIHSTDLASHDTATAVAATTAALDIGAHVSIYATAQGEADSAHLVHRNLTGQDGAIVVNPEAASPTWLLFSFSNQTF